jgi:secreted PhoX family phosphatase
MASTPTPYPFRTPRRHEPVPAEGDPEVSISRRTFLSATAAAAVALGASPAQALASAGRGPAPGRGRSPFRFGPLGPPDANGIALPKGFASRVVARQGQPVGRSGYRWHLFPDGGACFRARRGGWIYVSNCESLGPADGGAGALRFDRDARLVDAYPVLTGSSHNCAGGPTPWGTWLSCEEVERGRVFECDPSGRKAGVDRPALGRFVHEAAAVDRDARHVYLTEDRPDGRLYRFTASRRGDLRRGKLEVARVDRGRVSWLRVPDPSATSTPTRLQVPESTAFGGGEGIWWVDGAVTFVTKYDHRLWRLDPSRGRISLVYDALAASANGVLGEPDNIIVTHTGDVFVCEDQQQDQQLVVIDRRGRARPFLQLLGQTGSELAGVAFNPHGDRLYVSSQRGSDRSAGPGITYEIRGPFRNTGWGRGIGHS